MAQPRFPGFAVSRKHPFVARREWLQVGIVTIRQERQDVAGERSGELPCLAVLDLLILPA